MTKGGLEGKTGQTQVRKTGKYKMELYIGHLTIYTTATYVVKEFMPWVRKFSIHLVQVIFTCCEEYIPWVIETKSGNIHGY